MLCVVGGDEQKVLLDCCGTPPSAGPHGAARGGRETVADSEQRLINRHILEIMAPEANPHLSSLE